jgi:hypothetical protein
MRWRRPWTSHVSLMSKLCHLSTNIQCHLRPGLVDSWFLLSLGKITPRDIYFRATAELFHWTHLSSLDCDEVTVVVKLLEAFEQFLMSTWRIGTSMGNHWKNNVTVFPLKQHFQTSFLHFSVCSPQWWLILFHGIWIHFCQLHKNKKSKSDAKSFSLNFLSSFPFQFILTPQKCVSPNWCEISLPHLAKLISPRQRRRKECEGWSWSGMDE